MSKQNLDSILMLLRSGLNTEIDQDIEIATQAIQDYYLLLLPRKHSAFEGTSPYDEYIIDDDWNRAITEMERRIKEDPGTTSIRPQDNDMWPEVKGDNI